MQSRKISKKDHLLFDDVNEFNQFMPETPLVNNWRDGNEGDWVLCDDGQICQILKRNTLKKGEGVKSDYVRTVMGSFICSGNYKMSGEMRKNIYTFSPKYDSAYKAKKDRKNPTRNEFMFAKYVAKGDNMVDAFVNAFPTNSREYAEKEAKFLMNTKRVRNLIREEIDKIMNEAEITPLYILEKMKDIIESTNSRDSDKVSLLKELVSIAGMKDTDTKSESVTVFQGFSAEQLEAIGGGGNKKLASAKRELKS